MKIPFIAGVYYQLLKEIKFGEPLLDIQYDDTKND